MPPQRPLLASFTAMDPKCGIEMVAGMPGSAGVPGGKAFGKWKPRALGVKSPTVGLILPAFPRPRVYSR
jgi:hypothetical protein